MIIGPIVLILASALMLCGQLSPKGLFGPGRHDKGMSPEEWYRTNRVAGAAFLTGGLIWLAAAILLPGRFDTVQQEQETIAFIGATAVGVAMVVSVMYVERESAER